MKPVSEGFPELSILYVEDEPVIRKAFGSTLQKKYPDLKVHCAENGIEGLSLYQKCRSDIVITDINMPIMDGISMSREIRLIDHDVVIIALTAYTDTEYLMNAVEIGINHYILKPINYGVIFEKIDACIATVRLRRQVTEQNAYIRKLSRAVEGSPTSIIITNRDGIIEYVNPKFTVITGYSLQEVLGQSASFLRSGLTPQNTYDDLRQSLSAGQEWKGEFINKKKNGEIYWVTASLSPIIDEFGSITHYVAIQEDISLQKQKDAELRKSTEMIRALIEAAPLAIMTLDRHAHVTLWSPSAEKLLGWPASEVIDKPIIAFLGKDMQGNHKLLLQELAVQPVIGLELEQVRSDGLVINIALWSTPLTDSDGAILGAAVFVIDITDRKQADKKIIALNESLRNYAAELEAANRELTSFNYMVTHDLRQPLTNISGFSQLIHQIYGEQLDDQCRKWISEIHGQTQKMKMLVETLLNFSGLAHIEPKRESVDLTSLAKSVAEELKVRDPQRSVDMTIKDDLSTIGDRQLLTIVLENLLGNAWKYTAERSDARIEFGKTLLVGKQWFYVKDNGIGFANSDSDRLFLPFSRLPGSQQFSGHGIGLATVERIIKRHGGRIEAKGTPGKGATFFFSIDT